MCVSPRSDWRSCWNANLLDWLWHLEADEKAAAGILARCAEVEPQLINAEILGIVSVPRPTREPVRVEADRLPDGTPLVHNYGHGGAGVTLSWGCAVEVEGLLGGL